jgi:hypothetical protein
MAMVHLSSCFLSLVLRLSQPLPTFPSQPSLSLLAPSLPSPQILPILFHDMKYFPGAHIR